MFCCRKVFNAHGCEEEIGARKETSGLYCIAIQRYIHEFDTHLKQKNVRYHDVYSYSYIHPNPFYIVVDFI